MTHRTHPFLAVLLTIAMAPALAAAQTSGPAPGDGIEMSRSTRSRSMVTKAINGAAKGVLMCAHPTARYRGASVDAINVSRAGVTADFTIAYQCTVIDRRCSMSLRVGYRHGRFTGVRVLRDSAFTDATVGLRMCGKLIGLLR